MRKAANEPRMGAAVQAWLMAQDGHNEEADIALDAALLAQGITTPLEIVECIEAEEGAVSITVDDGTTFQIGVNGRVFT